MPQEAEGHDPQVTTPGAQEATAPGPRHPPERPPRPADRIDETLADSFPASDPPPWWAGAGGPRA